MFVQLQTIAFIDHMHTAYGFEWRSHHAAFHTATILHAAGALERVASHTTLHHPSHQEAPFGGCIKQAMHNYMLQPICMDVHPFAAAAGLNQRLAVEHI